MSSCNASKWEQHNTISELDKSRSERMAAIDDLWHPPPAERSLSENTVHVWQAELDLPESRIQLLAQTLLCRRATESQPLLF